MERQTERERQGTAVPVRVQRKDNIDEFGAAASSAGSGGRWREAWLSGQERLALKPGKASWAWEELLRASAEEMLGNGGCGTASKAVLHDISVRCGRQAVLRRRTGVGVCGE
jgi:hypothetical protein